MSKKIASNSPDKKKLLVVAGAGASMDFGMPSVNQIHENFLSWASNNFSFVNNPSVNLYGYIHDHANEYRNHYISPDQEKRYQLNFENILYTIYSLARTYPKGINTSPLGAFVGRKNFPNIIYAEKPCLVDSHMLSYLASDLIDKLLDDFRERCAAPCNILNLYKMNNFFAVLQDKFDVAVATVNYDNLIYRSLGKVETGFDIEGNGEFKQERILSRKRPWRCILHLHGSVHFDMDIRNGNLHEIIWQDDLTKPFHQNSEGRNSSVTTEGNEFPTSNIIVGNGKTEQIQGYPFRTYYSELDRLVHESDALLFLGYGFGDTHINQAFSTYRDHRNRPVVIIDYADDKTDSAGTGFSTKEGVLSIFKAMHIIKIQPSTTAVVVKQLKEQKEFERFIDKTQHLSVWFNGMKEACEDPGKIVSELVGGKK